jgi:osmotically-inducible protein OsmY
MSSDQEAIAILTRPNPFAALFQEIAEIAQAALRRSAYCELRDVSCDYSGGILTLRGRVPTYHLKQIAQASVADVPGVVEVHNRVEVASAGVPPSLNTGLSEHETLASIQTG